MRWLVSVLLALILFIGLSPGVLAADLRTTVVNVAVITEEATHLISIGWERGDLSVTLIAPDGTRVPQDNPPAGTRVALGDRIVIFRIDSMAAGLWKAEFQEYDNGHVGIITQKLYRPLLVKNVTAVQEGDGISVSFSLAGEENSLCEYDIYLSLDGQYQHGRLLRSGETSTGETVSLLCPAADVSSYDGWYVTVYAQCRSDGYTDFHSATSAAFTYANPDAPGPVKKLTATVLEGGIRAAWRPPDGEAVIGYLAVLYGGDGAVLHSVEVGKDQLEALLPTDAAGPVTLAVSSIRNGLTGLPATLAVDTARTLTALVGFDLPEQPSAAGGYVTLLYNASADKVPLTVDIDGDRRDMTITGAGALRLSVHNGINRVTVSAQCADGIWLSDSRTWMIDLVPPTLRIFEDWDAVETSDEMLWLSGHVDGAVALTVNGQATQIGANGNFGLEVALAPGRNDMTVTALDAAGNSAVYEARVTRVEARATFPWALLVGLVVAALAVAAYALAGGRRRRV